MDQILGQFVSNEKVGLIRLVKYCPCNDDIIQDLDSPLAPWRGLVFEFERRDYESSIAEMAKRIRLFDAFISSGINPAEFKNGEWSVVDGNLIKS